MLLRIYGLAWLLGALAAGITYLTGHFNELALIAFGFILSTLVFMGIIAVLPSLAGSHFSPKL